MASHSRMTLPIALIALLLAGCAPAPSATSASATAAAPEATADSLVGTYSIEFRTVESDRDAITDEVVVRSAEVSGSCSGSDCALQFTTELKGADGGTLSETTALSFDGTTYTGSQSLSVSCDGMTSLTTIEDGLEYTSETTITPTATGIEDGLVVVQSFEIVIVEHNEITTAGREAGCSAINLTGTDPYASNVTTLGVATRER